MSTRSTTHFLSAGADKPTAIIYRHPDGYPEGAGADILDFLDQCAELSDSRFNDPSYLAAKYVVFLADMFNYSYHLDNLDKTRPKSRLDFISVGVVDEDPGDIDYRYVITCHGRDKRPSVHCYTHGEGDWTIVGDWQQLAEKARQPSAS